MERFALVVGVDDYGSAYQPLEGCLEDADGIADYLEEAQFNTASLGDVTKPQLEQGLGKFKEKLKACKNAGGRPLVVFYFTGYGYDVSVGPDLRLVTKDGLILCVRNELEAELAPHADKLIIILDLCRIEPPSSDNMPHKVQTTIPNIPILQCYSCLPVLETPGANKVNMRGIFTTLMMQVVSQPGIAVMKAVGAITAELRKETSDIQSFKVAYLLSENGQGKFDFALVRTNKKIVKTVVDAVLLGGFFIPKLTVNILSSLIKLPMLRRQGSHQPQVRTSGTRDERLRNIIRNTETAPHTGKTPLCTIEVTKGEHTGIYFLREPPEKPEVDIVFFHGLQIGKDGDDTEAWWRTWQSKDRCTIWPQAFLPKHYRLISVQWDARAATSAEDPATSWHNTATSIVDMLTDSDVGVGTTAPCVLLVGHSMGGLMIKEVVEEAWKTKSKPATPDQGRKAAALVDKLCGFVFYGTPHHGAWGASVSGLVPDAAKKFLAWAITGNDHVSQALMGRLAIFDDRTARLNHELTLTLKNHLDNAPILCFVETKPVTHALLFRLQLQACVLLFISIQVQIPMIGPHMVVEEEAATISGCVRCSVEANHFDVCKPAGETSPDYRTLKAFVASSIETVGSSTSRVMPRAWQAPHVPERPDTQVVERELILVAAESRQCAAAIRK